MLFCFILCFLGVNKFLKKGKGEKEKQGPELGPNRCRKSTVHVQKKLDLSRSPKGTENNRTVKISGL